MTQKLSLFRLTLDGLYEISLWITYLNRFNSFSWFGVA